MGSDYFNRNAFVVHRGVEYRFDPEDYPDLSSPLLYWHSRTVPSSWLCTAVVSRGRAKFQNRLPRSVLMSLCALLLNTTVKKLEGVLEWHANYMAWHDGGTPREYHPCPPEED